jgi:transcriptional regulator with XRE-family HTH domain
MHEAEIQPWFFLVKPYLGESISHFLGRFRRANALTSTSLSKAAGLGGALARWEKFRFNPRPSQEELEALAAVVGVSAGRLAQMLPPVEIAMKHEPIRLCGACYAEQPYHHMEWQYKTTNCCNHHGLALLSECPKCGARFKVPALWINGHCHRCFIPFAEMEGAQKIIN